MRSHYLSLALLLAGCSSSAPRPPPDDRFIYPSGLVHRSVPGSNQGVLYVASANFDRCFDQGTVMAVELDKVGTATTSLPPIGTATSAEPLQIDQLNLASQSRVFIDSFAGELAVWERQDGAPRLFVPTRSERGYLHAIDVPEPARLDCVGTDGDDCLQGAVSLIEVPGAVADQPRAPSPIGVTVSPSGEVWVTHAEPADSPAGSRQGLEAYVVRMDGAQLSPSVDQFYPLSLPELPLGGSHSVAVGERYVFITGRLASSTNQSRRFLVRVLDRTDPRRVIDPGLDMGFAALEARGIVLTEKDPARPELSRRMYVVARSPSALLVVDVQGDEPGSIAPRLTVVGSVSLPEGASMVKLVSRRAINRSDLVVVSSSSAGVVSIYDPDVGQVVAQVPVGELRGDDKPRPYALAVQQEGSAARIFASNFGDGRISVIDIPDIKSPQQARLVAWLGARQDREGSTGAASCQEAEQ